MFSFEIINGFINGKPAEIENTYRKYHIANHAQPLKGLQGWGI